MLVTAPQVLLAVAVVLASVILRASVKPGGAPLLILLCGAGYALSGVAIRALAIPLAPAAPKSPSALKIGLIGAAKIAPDTKYRERNCPSIHQGCFVAPARSCTRQVAQR